MINNYIFKFSLPAHKKIKKKLLEHIAQEPAVAHTKKNDSNSCYDIISRSDFTTPGGERKYWEYLSPFLYDFMEETYRKKLRFKETLNIHYWFQQYVAGDTHPWHRHNYTFFTNVYYVELDKNAPPTEIFLPLEKNILVPDVKEGDILSFPSFLLHRSPVSKSKKIKTIISFNVTTDLQGYPSNELWDEIVC